jgi:hypothetical protein
MAVDIPGQMIVDLNEPDAQGIWPLALSRDVAFSFEGEPGGGPRSVLNLHQTTSFPRIPSEDAGTDPDAPAGLAPLLGTYALPAARIEMKVRVQQDGLALEIKGQGVVELTPLDEEGLWKFSDDATAKVSFVRDASGRATVLKLHRTFAMPRKTG